jgi:hypothetical protein
MGSLAEKLEIPLHAAVGIMEMLWHYSGEYTPKGDIGRLADGVIAKAVDWRGDTSKLISVLIQTGWLDVNEEHRLVIHDWPQHCEQYVERKLERCGQKFLSVYKINNKQSKKATSQRLVADESLTSSREARQGKAPSVLKTTTVEVSLSPLEGKIKEVALAIHARHPEHRRTGFSKNNAIKNITTISKSFPAAERIARIEEINKNHEAWCDSSKWGEDDGKWVKGLSNWLSPSKSFWSDPPTDSLFRENAERPGHMNPGLLVD